MSELSDNLCDNLKTDGEVERVAWCRIRSSLAEGLHLEAALEAEVLPENLLTKIVALTWQCVNDKDVAVLKEAALKGQKFELGELLSEMFNSTQTEIHVVTTNYDRVAEYACNSKGVLFQTGFAPGYIQKWESSAWVKFSHSNKKSRVVKIWKVHGSLDWFSTPDERHVGLPVFELPSAQFTPLIVTPGLNKYEKTHEDPFRTTINGADAAIRSSSGFLCVGFGFRDRHIHPTIIERCQEGNVPIVVLAQKLTEEAKLFLRDKAGSNYLGIEQSDSGSVVYSAETPNGVKVGTEDLWTLSGFASFVL